MVVVGPDGFMKNQYRKFNFKNENLVPGDDFGMMREVLERRIRRLSKEDPDRGLGMWPDLIIIDGGAGQVSAVGKVLADLGIEDVAMVGVAKGVDRNHGKEEFYMLNRPAFALEKMIQFYILYKGCGTKLIILLLGPIDQKVKNDFC